MADLARRCPHITDDKNKSRTQKIIANTKVNIRNQKMLLPNSDNFDYLTLTFSVNSGHGSDDKIYGNPQNGQDIIDALPRSYHIYCTKETEEGEGEKYIIDLDEARYGLANMQLVAKDRMREIKLWSTLKKEFDDGSFDTQDVNRHQLDSYHLIMKNKAETLTQGSSQPEVFNVLGQLQTIERVKKSGEMIYNKKEQLTSDLGAKDK